MAASCCDLRRKDRCGTVPVVEVRPVVTMATEYGPAAALVDCEGVSEIPFEGCCEVDCYEEVT